MTRECRRSDFNRCRSTCFLPLRSSSSIFFLSYILLSPLFLPIKIRLVSFPLDLARPASFPFHSNYIYIYISFDANIWKYSRDLYFRNSYNKRRILFICFSIQEQKNILANQATLLESTCCVREPLNLITGRRVVDSIWIYDSLLFETESNINPGSSMCNSIILSKNLDSLYIHDKDVSSPYNNPRKDNTAVRFPKIRFLAWLNRWQKSNRDYIPTFFKMIDKGILST